ncbi:MAG TPA: diacylglycerol kinase [Bdellovibrionales bacterium]|nr:diacylglycerol kinase [Bdellovibrionales bacterium]
MKSQSFFLRFNYALQGLKAAWAGELSFRVEIILGLGAFGLLCYLRPAPAWWALVAIVSGGVLAAELINTALERALDKLHPVRDPLIGVAKDCAAAAVLIMSLASLAVLCALLYDSYAARI